MVQTGETPGVRALKFSLEALLRGQGSVPGENQVQGLFRPLRDEGYCLSDNVVERQSLLAIPCRGLTAGLRAFRHQELKVQCIEKVDEAWWESGMIQSLSGIATGQTDWEWNLQPRQRYVTSLWGWISWHPHSCLLEARLLLASLLAAFTPVRHVLSCEIIVVQAALYLLPQSKVRWPRR